MSIKTKALAAAISAAFHAAGATLTRVGRRSTAVSLVEFLFAHNFQIRDVDSLRVQHIVLYIHACRDAGDVLRTLQNKAAHIRCLLRAEGRKGLADDPLLSNKSLEISGASRRGTNHAVSCEVDQRIIEAAQQRPDYVLATVRLQRALGLRALEAVRSGPSLARWEKELLNGRRVGVVAGTKGGRRRDVQPSDRAEALAAVRCGLAVLRATNRQDLFPQRSLKQAITYYQNTWHRWLTPAASDGCTSHSYRYAFAQDRIAQCIKVGMSRRDALASVALDLGHGDGRGRYIKHVYAHALTVLEKS